MLAEIGADEVPTWLLLNKIDRVDEAGREALPDRYPRAIQLSAKDPADVAALRDRLIEHFIGALEEAELDVPWSLAKLSHVIHERTTVLSEEHGDDGTMFQVRAPAGVLDDDPRVAKSELTRRPSRRHSRAPRTRSCSATTSVA